ncbi:hypothetical protein TVAG_181910 [Trichomonas vaginalis G3]|uniref:Uncharacterized protein n=1 Tax=Trichomonas vaginalis (strain ATCC PRA-98 / G3) TaxID=412133 RepID=A2F6X3_TRIV3|nr:hypothetical protein TVAGG3_0007430 [Trichomonas vaginalis G3]EAX99334.1 hypothetical protein TVAG_181910 [Trichomonas vaginalis G3]KAI5538977.1 hypothetical protein TVAGG3_0007430 [Trichomonas vaginalis G3]|eukprot:XP_001312264.1 hypothetical protein [Trichomonas vaginalis G3]
MNSSEFEYSETGSYVSRHSKSGGSAKYSAVTNQTLPELTFFDLMHNKMKKADFFNKWNLKTKLRRQKQQAYQSCLVNPDFDKESRANSLFEAADRLTTMNAFRKLKNERDIAAESLCFCASMKHRILCKSFGTWETKYYNSLLRRTTIEQTKINSSSTERASDIFRQLHEQISKHAELSLIAEQNQKEISDVNALIFDTKTKLKNTQNQILEAANQNKRVKDMKRSVEIGYKDQIAKLKMQILHSEDQIQQQLSTAKEVLQQKHQEAELTNESIIDSKDKMMQRLSSIQERLNKTQFVAMNLRDEILSQQNIESELTEEVQSLQSEIDQLTYECNTIEQSTTNYEQNTDSSIQDLIALYNKAQETQKNCDAKIKENREILQRQNTEIERLNQALALIQHHRKTTELAFTEEEGEEEEEAYQPQM